MEPNKKVDQILQDLKSGKFKSNFGRRKIIEKISR